MERIRRTAAYFLIKRVLLIALILLVFISVLVGVLYNFATNNLLKELQNILSNENILKSGQFDRLDESNIIGPEDSLFIYSSKGNLIYAIGQEKKRINYGANLPSIYNIYAPVTKYSYGENNYTMLVSEGFMKNAGWFLLLDEKYQQVASNITFENKPFYTDEDIEKLLNIGQYYKNYSYEFISKGQTMEAVIVFNQAPFKNIQAFKGLKAILNVIMIFFLLILGFVIFMTIKDYKRLTIEKHNILTGLSHDLKTPLTVSNGYAYALMYKTEINDEQKEFLSSIIEKNNEVNNYVELLLEYNKLDHPIFKMKKDSINIGEFIAKYVESQRSVLLEMGHSIDVEIADVFVFCSVDKLQLARCFDNILQNFIKHNEMNECLRFRAHKNKKRYTIYIENTGKKIPDEIKAYIFDLFKCDESHVDNHFHSFNKASGIGLTNCRKILELHKGKIELSQTDNEYTVSFKIELPIN